MLVYYLHSPVQSEIGGYRSRISLPPLLSRHSRILQMMRCEHQLVNHSIRWIITHLRRRKTFEATPPLMTKLESLGPVCAFRASVVFSSSWRTAIA